MPWKLIHFGKQIEQTKKHFNWRERKLLEIIRTIFRLLYCNRKLQFFHTYEATQLIIVSHVCKFRLYGYRQIIIRKKMNEMKRKAAIQALTMNWSASHQNIHRNWFNSLILALTLSFTRYFQCASLTMVVVCTVYSSKSETIICYLRVARTKFIRTINA